MTRLTAEQEKLLDAACAWYKSSNRSRFFLVAGPAGTGKSFMAQRIHEALGIQSVASAGPTGKSANVLARKGLPNCTTLHRLLYNPTSKSRTRLLKLEQQLVDMSPLDPSREDLLKEIRAERELVAKPSFNRKEDNPARDLELIFVDESSMIDERLGSDLLGLGVPIIAFGDNYQLPPVNGKGFFKLDKPDFMLTQLMRQSMDNPIVRLATDARNQKELELGQYGTSSVIQRGDVGDKLSNPGQILAGKNATVSAVNSFLRKKAGRTGALPEVGDRLICLQNNYDTGCMNGQVWEVIEPSLEFDENSVVVVMRNPDDGAVISAECFTECFKDPKCRPPYGTNGFTFGYCMTVHKSQGSEFPHVVVLDESTCFRQDRWKWLYTGISRASESVIVVKDYEL